MPRIRVSGSERRGSPSARTSPSARAAPVNIRQAPSSVDVRAALGLVASRS
jgi:hypothetical protein